ncbi:MAG TPA: UvrD-helicase domain-containing protein [Chloroflexia bacterium]|nr:UvrD-helicase domain-containing protein [Chloroflexia bacterium]
MPDKKTKHNTSTNGAPNGQMSFDLMPSGTPDSTPEPSLPEEPAWLRDTPPPMDDGRRTTDDRELTPSSFVLRPSSTSSVVRESILAGLNPQQREAVETTRGPLLIIAGPGSGKTRVLTHRIAYLMEVEDVWPSRICAVTFTNKAASEMKQRLEKLVGPRAKELTVGTFHALGARILRQHADALGYRRDFAIYDDDDQVGLVKQAMKDLDLSDKQYSPRSLLSRISSAKAVLAQPEQAARQAETFYEEVAARVYRRYQELLTANHALDFDDLIMLTIELFTEHPDILHHYQERYLYVLVDEYQDTSHSQYIMVKLLSGIHHNICVVGDEDQSVYGWRAADIRNILNFEQDNPAAKVIVLGQNYRSTQTILKVADKVIAQNTQRKQKQLWTENDDGLPVTLFEAYDESEEAQYVAREVRRLTSSGYSHKDIAVMYRTNAQSREVEQACMLYKVPYQLVGGVRFYSRKEVKDVLSVLKVMHNPESNIDFIRLVGNTPLGKGIGAKTISELEVYAARLNVSLFDAMRIAIKSQKPQKADDLPPGTPVFAISASKFAPLLATLEELIASRHELPVVGLLDLLLEKTRFQEFLQDGTQEGEERWQNVMELRTVAENYADLPFPEQLGRFLEDVALMSDIDTLKEERDAITLITLHAAKGLEFPVVFIVGMDEGILPHKRALDEEELGKTDGMEEERRLAYVGITRAKQRLYMVYAFRRTLYGMTQTNGPSRFLADVPPELVTGRDPGTAFQPALFGGKRATVPQKGLSAEDILNNRASIYGSGRSVRDRLSPSDRRPTPPTSPRVEKRRDEKREQQSTRLNITSGADIRDRAQGSGVGDRGSGGFKVGEKVTHSVFGDGHVLAVKPVSNDEEVTVMFGRVGTKRLLASMAKLERVS